MPMPLQPPPPPRPAAAAAAAGRSSLTPPPRSATQHVSPLSDQTGSQHACDPREGADCSVAARWPGGVITPASGSSMSRYREQQIACKHGSSRTCAPGPPGLPAAGAGPPGWPWTPAPPPPTAASHPCKSAQALVEATPMSFINWRCALAVSTVLAAPTTSTPCGDRDGRSWRFVGKPKFC
jgi:hypothetical protein